MKTLTPRFATRIFLRGELLPNLLSELMLGVGALEGDPGREGLEKEVMSGELIRRDSTPIESCRSSISGLTQV